MTKAGVTSATKDVYNKIVFTTPEEFSAAVKNGNIYTYANGTYTPVSKEDDLKDVVYFEKSTETVDAVQGIITITFTMPSDNVKIEGLPKA